MRINTKLTIACLGALFAVTSANADLVGSWSFQGNLNSDMGGAALVAVDPLGQNSFTSTTLYGQSHQVYNMFGGTGAGNNAGLMLATPNFLGNNSNYSLEMLFSVANSNGTGYRKIYDNSGNVSDAGLYVSPGSEMEYYPHDGGVAPIGADTFYNVVMTFNASTSALNVYVNGVLDSTNTAAEANIGDNTIPLSFFIDDAHTSFGEYSNASVGLIRMWNTELNSGAVADIENNPFTGAPEPGSMAVLGLGVVALIARRRRRSA